MASAHLPWVATHGQCGLPGDPGKPQAQRAELPAPCRTHLAAAAIGLLTLAGCSGVVDLEPADLDPDAEAICADLLTDLPRELAGQGRRDVAPAGSGVAWGDPAVTLRCGVTDAQGLGRASECQVVNGVGWYPEELSDSYRFTTVGRATPVEVVVPDAYAPEVGPLTELADAVARHDPEVRACV